MRIRIIENNVCLPISSCISTQVYVRFSIFFCLDIIVIYLPACFVLLIIILLSYHILASRHVQS